MPTREMKAKLKLEGEQQFRKGMKDASDAIKVLNSEQKLAQAQFELTGDKEQLLADKTEILKKKIEEQQKAVQIAQKAVDQMRSKGVEPTNKAMVEWTTKLNNAKAYLTRLEADLNGTESELAQQSDAFEEAGDSAQEYGEQLENIGKGVDFSNTIASLDRVQEKLKNALTFVTNIANSIWEAEIEASKWADELLTTATMAGMSVEDVQAMRYASRFIDTPFDDIISAQDKVLNKLQSTSEETALIFNRLGIETKEAGGELRDYKDVFWEVIDALHKEKDAYGQLLPEKKKDEIAQELLGRSYRDMKPLIEAGSEAYKERMREAKESSVVVSEAEVDMLGKLNDAYEAMDARIEAAKERTAAALSEPATKFADAVSEILNKYNEFLQTPEGQAAIQALSDAMSSLVEKVTSVDFSGAMGLATTAIEKLTTALGWITEHGWAVIIALLAIKGAIVGIEVTKSVLTALQLLKSIQWLNMKKGAESLGKTLTEGGGGKAAETAAAGGGSAGGGGAAALASKALNWVAEKALSSVVTGPLAGFAIAAPIVNALDKEATKQYEQVIDIIENGDAELAAVTDESVKHIGEIRQQFADAFANMYDESYEGPNWRDLIGQYGEELESMFGDLDAWRIIRDNAQAAVDKETGKIDFSKLIDPDTVTNMNAGKWEQIGVEIVNALTKAMENTESAQQIGDSIAQAVETATSEAAEKVDEVTEKAAESATQTYETGVKSIDEIFAKYRQETQAAYDDAEKQMQESYDAIRAAYETAGENVDNGFAEGVNNNAGAVSDAAGNMADGAISAVEGTLQINSPSRVMRMLGEYAAQGLADGINARASAAIAAAQNLAAQVQAALSYADAAMSYGASMSRSLYATPVYGSYGSAVKSAASTGVINNTINIDGQALANSITPYVSGNMTANLRAQRM